MSKVIYFIKERLEWFVSPLLALLVGSLLTLASIQIEESRVNVIEDRALKKFQPSSYQKLVAEEKEPESDWDLEILTHLQVRLPASHRVKGQLGLRLETILTRFGKPQKVSYSQTATQKKGILCLTYTGKQGEQMVSVALWFEEEGDKGYRLTLVDATNLVQLDENIPSRQDLKQGIRESNDLEKILKTFGQPTSLVWGRLSTGNQGYRVLYQTRDQSSVLLEFEEGQKARIIDQKD